MANVMAGKVCLVTGATRGIGKGIALQLGKAGATVYITGRTLKPRPGKVGGSLEETAKEIEERGGKCIPVQCDHSKESDIEELFARIQREQEGQLDVLVNNAYAAVETLLTTKSKFWEQEPTVWDEVNNVGLRNHYFCAVYASRMMVPRKQGLIVNVSSIGGLRYLFSVPYGIGKEACDRMAVDCAIELRPHNVAYVSLWPGAVKTEVVMSAIDKEAANKDVGDDSPSQMAALFKDGESTEFSGKCIVHMAQDRNIIKKSGRIMLSAELGEEYGFTDIDGREIQSMRSVRGLVALSPFSSLAGWVPSFLRIPFWLLATQGHKF